MKQKFFPPTIIRFAYRYIMVALYVGFPLYFSTIGIQTVVVPEDRPAFFVVGFLLTIFGCVLIYFAFWEKFFGVLILDSATITWRCPFKKTIVIPLSQCKEIGGDIENAKSGIPFEIIYFSTKSYPQKNSNKNGIVKYSSHYIKFWYSEELYRYIVKNYPSFCTGRLVYYHQKRKR